MRLTTLGAKTIKEADDLAPGIEAKLRVGIGEELFDGVLRIEQITKDLLQ